MQKGMKKYFWLFVLPTLIAFIIAFLVPFIMGIYYLAVDIGASSGRHILCHMENGKMQGIWPEYLNLISEKSGILFEIENGKFDEMDL